MRALAPAAALLLAACPAPRAPRPPALDAIFEPGPDLLVDRDDHGWPTPEMSVYLIDVGQGAATLLEFSCGAVLIDAGGEKNPRYSSVEPLHEFLEAFFARRADLDRTLDLVVFTHPHTDHLRGGDTVLKHFRVRNVVTNGMTTGSAWKAQERFERTAGAPVEHVHAASVPAGGLTSAVIDPLACADADPQIFAMWGQVARADVPWTKTVFDDENNHSVALRVRFDRATLLFTGDLEDEGLAALIARHGDALDADLLQVGHHGARNGTNQPFLDAVTPLVALIPAGPPSREGPFTAWDHGHPNIDAVTLLENTLPETPSRPAITISLGDGKHTFRPHTLTAPIYSTAWDGTVHLTINTYGRVTARTSR